MSALFRRLPKIGERTAFLLMLFATLLLGNFFTRGQFVLVTYVVVPWALGLFYLQIRRPFRVDAPQALMLAAAAWMALSSVWNRCADLGQFLSMAVAGAYALVLPAMGDETDLRTQRRELNAVALLLIACITPFMLVGVSTVFTGKPFYFFGENIPLGIRSEGGLEFRIWVFQHPNITARGALTAALFAVYGICAAKRRWLKALLGACIAVLVLALVHTQSRTCFIAFSAVAGAMVFRALWLRLPKRVWRLPVSLAAWAAAALAVLSGLNLIYMLDIRLAAALQPAVESVTGTPRAATEGAFAVFNNGRDRIWMYAWEYMCNHPTAFLTGLGAGDIMQLISAEIPEAAGFNHLHNSLIDCMLRGGIPLLLCVLGYLCLLVRPAVGLLTAEEDDESRGLFVMPLIIGAMLLMSLTESMLFVHNCMANGVFFLACGHTLRGWKNRKRKEK